ncbi:OmpP1/FadL family transporter [Cypionkella sp.]|uniref:OmpP1/FadL family transporter n=1 Tax=Cypionkella sp. TaxID=2811411 RepID=UPI002ABB9133|nr:outer membrane protein transport protein [Cypionkella sp.]MDZ4394868.1 outer membrane protein transport protein [Cypionkella sp.]
MKHIVTALGALAMTTTLVQAGGIDRSGTSYSALFDKGRVATIGFSSVTPSVSGVFTHPLAGAIPTGNMSESYTTLSFSYKADINDKLSYAIFLNQPYGADAHYKEGIYTGLEAHWKSTQLAALLKYNFNDRVSAYGGLRLVRSSAEINIPVQMLSPPATPIVIGPYTASTDTDTQVGYVVGAAYQIPDIALRVALTYESSIKHEFATSERFAGLNGGATIDGKTEISMPQSVTLDFQSGVAKDTLVFGSVTWSEWSKWHVRPDYYNGVINDEITGFSNNVITYELGVGRKINDNLSVFARIGFEESDGEEASRLSPTDGRRSFGVGGSWTKDNVKVTGGVEYVKLGDAVDASGTKFSGNDAVGVGVNVAFTF